MSAKESVLKANKAFCRAFNQKGVLAMDAT